jgi:polysaccharide export outer membrane protein
MLMKRLQIVYFFSIITFLFSVAACGTGGNVVKVTKVNETALETLGEEQRAQLEQIKQDANTQDIDPEVTQMIEATPNLSVSEYLAEHPEAKGTEGADYAVGGYDVLSITIYEEQDLSRNALRVSADGYISFPLIGRLEVEGLTTSDIEELISRRLAQEQYLLDAHVSVMVTEYNSQRFLILGAVENPGSYSLKARECLLDGISRAGGIDAEQQASRTAMIVRTHNSPKQGEHKVVINIDLQSLLKRGNQIANIYLADKDVIYVPPAEYFYIMGQVNHPGSFPIPDREITLVEAIGMAGGFTRIASRNKTRIIRVEDGMEKIIQVKVDAITKAGKKIQDVLIQPNDVIVVPESFF